MHRVVNERIRSSNLIGLDHLRFFAACLVFIYHFGQQPRADPDDSLAYSIVLAWVRNGCSGVTLFLVLSGFLFSVICGERQPKYWPFLSNRALRIFPLLFVILLMLITASRATWSPDDLIRFLTLQINTGNPTTGWGNHILPFGVIWTIGVEFQFYLLFPLLLALAHKAGYRAIVFMIGAICLVRFMLAWEAGASIYYNLYHTLLGRLDQFLIGMVCGHLYLKRFWSMRPAVAILITIAGMIGLTAYFAVFSVRLLTASLGFTLEGLLWAFVLVGYASAIRSRGPIGQFLSALAALTYSFYLWQFFIGGWTLATAVKAGLTAGSYPMDVFLYAFIPTLLFSVVTYWGIERPFLSLKMGYLTSR